MLTLYGITTCDTVRKARRWLEQHQIDYQYHDLRQQGIDSTTLEQWLTLQSWEVLLNTRSTTFRNLPVDAKQNIDEQRAIMLMLAHPTLIKRPVLSDGTILSVGFKVADYATRFGVSA